MQAIFKTVDFARRWRLFGAVAILPLAACSAADTDRIEAAAPQPVATATRCELGNALQGGLEGSISMGFRWSADDMDCDSMLRPDRDGPRLRFSGSFDDGTAGAARLTFILALPGLEAGQSDIEKPTNITLQIEGSGRFFSTPNLQACWTEISANAPTENHSQLHRVDGVVYCVAPLGELNSSNSVNITELAFSATVDWSES